MITPALLGVIVSRRVSSTPPGPSAALWWHLDELAGMTNDVVTSFNFMGVPPPGQPVLITTPGSYLYSARTFI